MTDDKELKTFRIVANIKMPGMTKKQPYHTTVEAYTSAEGLLKAEEEFAEAVLPLKDVSIVEIEDGKVIIGS